MREEKSGRKLGETRCGSLRLRWGERTYVMGILNVTPDSFAGDGVADDVEAALARAEAMAAQGVDIIDVGGESTRPGATLLPEEEEMGRVLPVVERLAARLSLPICVDTYKAGVARRALAAGAAMINDVRALTADPRMASVAAEAGVPIVLMHSQEGTRYGEVVGDVVRSLRERIEEALAAGIAWDNLIVDPGIGFGKTAEQNLELLRRLDELKALGRPILLGTSRKSTIGYVLGLPVHERLEGTAATVALGIAKGADMVRVHDVKEMVRVCRMSDAIVRQPRG